MKKILFVFSLILPLLLIAQDDAPPLTMYDNLLITPQKDKIMELTENIAAHNKKYHNEGPYSVNVYRIISGPDNGKMIWSMGPCNFGHLDENPGGEEHNTDWVKNVIPLTEDVSHHGFWNRNDKLSYFMEGATYPKLRIRNIDLKRGEQYRFNKLMANIRDVYAAKKYKAAHAIFNRRLASSDGKDIAVIFGYGSWSELDSGGLSADYEEVHGEGSWQLFLEEIEGCVESVDDELWQWMGDMSADTN